MNQVPTLQVFSTKPQQVELFAGGSTATKISTGQTSKWKARSHWPGSGGRCRLLGAVACGAPRDSVAESAALRSLCRVFKSQPIFLGEL